MHRRPRLRGMRTAVMVTAIAALTALALLFTQGTSTGSPRTAALAAAGLAPAAPAAPAVQAVTAAPEAPTWTREPKVTAATQAADRLAAYRHWFHENHLRQLAARKAATARAASLAQAAPSRQAPAVTSQSGTFAVTSSFQQCVIQRESGGNAQIWNASGHWGLYQFSYSTWVAHGGAPSAFGHAGAAEQTVVFWNTVRQDGTSDWAPYDGCGGSVSAPATTTSSVTSTSGSAASRAFAWALRAQGDWYCWGGNGTSSNGFGCPANTWDCSGLVMWAYAHVGLYLPHNTGAMLSSGKLVRTYSPVKGDLAFYGTGHVELYAGGRQTFGAHQTGQRIGYITEWETPTYYRVV